MDGALGARAVGGGPAGEPETKTFPVETLDRPLRPRSPPTRALREIGRIYREQRSVPVPPLTEPRPIGSRTAQMTGAAGLAGRRALLAAQATAISGATRTEDRVIVERVAYPSEGGILVPASCCGPRRRGRQAAGRRDAGQRRQEALLAETGPDSPRGRAERGSLVVLPDPAHLRRTVLHGRRTRPTAQAWERNGIVWGRPVPGMAATDLGGVLDGVAERSDADPSRVTVISRGSGDLAIAALFAMILDRAHRCRRSRSGRCRFDKRNLALVPRVLLYGDVPQWAALLADRKLRLRNVPPEAGDPAWLERVFAAVGNLQGLDRNP